jgi:Domain of unknown function (DUF1707)
MDEQRALRASDSDREAAVTRLRAALNEGRLNVHEYDDRMSRAYQAVTYGELADLFLDLPSPAGKSAVGKSPVVGKREVPAESDREPLGLFAALPTTLRVLWTVWFTAVCINLVVWTLVSIGNGDPEYFWPMWVIGPAGATLLGLSVAATAVRRGRSGGRRELTN